MSLPLDKKEILKLPPQNLDAEMAVLGAMLIDDNAIPEVLELIDDTHFYRQEHRIVFSSIVSLFDSRKKVDILTVSEYLNKKKYLESIGGASYLTTLVDFVPTAANVIYYAHIVKEKSILRSLVSHATKIIDSVYRGEEEVNVILDKAERLIFEISDKRIEGGYVQIKEIIKDRSEEHTSELQSH